MTKKQRKEHKKTATGWTKHVGVVHGVQWVEREDETRARFSSKAEAKKAHPEGRVFFFWARMENGREVYS